MGTEGREQDPEGQDPPIHSAIQQALTDSMGGGLQRRIRHSCRPEVMCSTGMNERDCRNMGGVGGNGQERL